MRVMGGYISNSFGANGFYAPPADVESKEALQTAVAAISAELPLNKNWTIRPQLSYRYNFDDYIFVRQHPEIYENKHYTHVLDAECNNTIRTGLGIIGFGLEFRNESINSNNLGQWSRMNYGLYGTYQFNKVNNLLVNIGTYLNYNVHFGWQLLPGIDAGFKLNKQWRLFADAGSGERLPTYTDWYYKGPQNIGNELLQPEKAFHSELGLKYNNTGLNATLSYFYQNTSDFIDWVKDSLGAAWQPQNFQKIKTTGISFSADYRFSDPGSRFSVLAGLSYTWLNPTITKNQQQPDLISKYTLENLRNQLCGRVHCSFLKFMNVTLTARYEQRVNYKDYTLLDARLAGKAGQFELYADMNNITDIQYIEAGAVPMPGRWFTLGLKWNWQK
jgi:iron complex outermembrane receptor protein